MRGEKLVPGRLWEGKLGSPPLARGKAAYNNFFRSPKGITPACAGKSVEIAFIYPVRRDHPRLRGEKFVIETAEFLLYGSPPLARGKVLRPEFLPLKAGITPACAGKSVRGLFFRCCNGDHPRLRGEKFALFSTTVSG